MNSRGSKLFSEPTLFQQVQVVIDTTFKTLFGDKWDAYLNDVAHRTGMTVMKVDGKEIFHGDWNSAENAHKLLQTGLFSIIGDSEDDVNIVSEMTFDDVAKMGNLYDYSPSTKTKIESTKINKADASIYNEMTVEKNGTKMDYEIDDYKQSAKTRRGNGKKNNDGMSIDVEKMIDTTLTETRKKDEDDVNIYTNTYIDTMKSTSSELNNNLLFATKSKIYINSNLEEINYMDVHSTQQSLSSYNHLPWGENVFSTEHCSISVCVAHGDLLTENVEAIVCPVSANFSKSILVSSVCFASGCTELLLTQKLKAPNDTFCYEVENNYKIIFILLPKVKTDYNINLKILNEVYTSIFEISEKMKFRSLALPSVGSGVSEFPVDVSANAAWRALENHSAKYKKKYLRLVRFVHIEYQLAFYFKTVFESLINSQQNIPHSHSTSPLLDESTGAISKRSSSSSSLSNASVKSSLINEENEKLENKCPICLGDITDCQILQDCNHKFCKSCLTESFKVRKECPVCRKQYGTITGNQPDGTMDFFTESSSLPGFCGCGTIVIHYNFKNGKQKVEHPNPGHHYIGTSRVAYLPDNNDGRKVLKLLRTAFDRKLTFTIGTSASTGQNDSVIWNGIHHKTNKNGGSTSYGYPDPDYLQRIQQELSEQGIKP